MIGRRFEDKEIQKEMKLISYKICKASNGDAWVQSTDGKVFSPSQVGRIFISPGFLSVWMFLEMFTCRLARSC